jgi:predicted ATPase/DNA-binding CsgD family transcriptional regulator
MHLTPTPAFRLPAEVTSFVGRRREATDVRRLLSDSRLVTLTGMGGVGKTRLAMRVATMVRRGFPDGVWMVDLGGRDAIGAEPALGRGRRMLVILDDCEHILDECAPMVRRLLTAVPGMSVLATSRQPLGLDSERIFTVPVLGRGDAVRLFTDRAEAMVPGFEEGDRRVIERICGALDDVPLAIELAALRLRALSPVQVLERLDDRFRLLSGGSRTVLPRHRSLSAMVEWSWRHCAPAERLVWARMSVFTGVVDPAAAEAVCAGDGLGRDKIAPALERLADKSVLVRDGDRYRLPRTIAAFGRRHLHAAAPLARHRDYFRNLAAEARAQMFGPDQVAWLTRLRLEHDNLIAALDRSTGRACLSMATDLIYHWIANYRPGDGRRQLERGLAAHTEATETRANALCTAGRLAIIQADPAAATAMLDESAALGRRLGLEPVLAYTALYRGLVAMHEGDSGAALALLTEAAARHEGTGDQAGLALSLTRLSLAHSLRGEAKQAIAVGERAIAVCEARGERWHKAYATAALGIELWRQGDTARATGLLRDCLRFNRSLGDRLGIGVNLEVLAWIAATERDHVRAARLLGALSGTWDAIGGTSYGDLAGHRDDCRARTRDALGEAAFRGAVSRGAGLSAEEAIAYALDESPPTGPLTPRESEIARLVAKGMSNKEIAAELVIAQRTAEGHVEHVLSKLGFTSRTEIASWVNEP